MENGIKKIEFVIDRIEENITSVIDYKRLAGEMTLSVYEFRRIFAFVVGCPVSEYVRKRRLSLAAAELMTSKKLAIKDVSEKYGYSTEAAFSKAFREMHGVSPTKCQNESAEIKLFTRPRFQLTVSGKCDVPFSVVKDDGYYIDGLKKTSVHTDSCCCDAVWGEFYDKGYDARIKGDKIYASYRDEGDEVLCTIGERTEGRTNSDAENIPESAYARFVLNTTDDDAVNKKYSEIIYEILPSAGMRRRADVPTVEVFPYDMSNNNFEWEIRIPIEKE